MDLNNIEWPKIINIEKGDANNSFNEFEIKINALIDKYMPLKKLTKKENISINHGSRTISDNLFCMNFDALTEEQKFIFIFTNENTNINKMLAICFQYPLKERKSSPAPR